MVAKKISKLVLAFAFAMGAFPPAFASGTVSGAGGADAYARGKAVFARKLTCESCPFATGIETADLAQSALKRIESGEFGLDDGERKAVRAFIERRFRLA